MSEEFSRVSELCAALGTDLGVVLLASITWEEEENAWVVRSEWPSEVLINYEPSNCWLGEGR